MKFLAAVLTELSQPLSLREVELRDRLKPAQVLVKIERTAICGSQIGEITGIKGPDRYLPHLLGHEALGVVIDKGDSPKFSNGDQVIMHWIRSRGRESEVPRYYDGNLLINAGNIATFGELAVISENRLTKIPYCSEDLKNIFSTVGCSFLTAYGTITRVIGIENLKKVLVTGGGGLGQSFIFLIKSIANSHITLLEKSEVRAAYCKHLSADLVFSALEPSISTKTFTSAIETTGQVSVIETSFSLLDTSGILALVGVSPAGEKISIDPMPLHYGREIKGVYGGNADPDLDIPILLDLLGSNEAKDSLKFYSSSLSEINNLIEHTKRADLEGRAIVLCQ